MPLQVNLFIGPGPDSRASGTALSSALDRLSAAQAISWNRVVPATETGLRQGLAARPCELCYRPLVADEVRFCSSCVPKAHVMGKA